MVMVMVTMMMMMTIKSSVNAADSRPT